MKKITVLAAVTAAAFMMYGCASQPAEASAAAETEVSTAQETEEEAAEAETEAAAAGGQQIGIAVVTDATSSKDAGAEDGLAQLDTTVAGVLLDANGTILDCVIDATQSRINFDASGKLTTDLATTYDSKNVLGEGYGMKTYSGIGKEWDEQAQAFAEYCVGKNLEELRGIQVTEGKAADVDLASSVTMGIGSLRASVIKAVKEAVPCEAQAADQLGIAMATKASKSKDAADGADGEAQAYGSYAVTAVNAEGVITACEIEELQAKVKFDAEGKLTSDLLERQQSKGELGEAYGMKVASTIGKEWDEQADAFAAHCIGKTAEEVNGIAVTDGYVTDADLASQVTLHVGAFMDVVSRAAASAN